MILQVTALLLSGVWGLAVGGSAYGYWGGNKAAMSSGIAIGAVAFFLGLLTLAFINSSESLCQGPGQAARLNLLCCSFLHS